MAGLVLEAEERAHLLRMMRRQTNSHVHCRMNVLLLLDDGWRSERIAEALYIDAETVREHRRRYESSGIAGLERPTYEGSEPALRDCRKYRVLEGMMGRKETPDAPAQRGAYPCCLTGSAFGGRRREDGV